MMTIVDDIRQASLVLSLTLTATSWERETRAYFAAAFAAAVALSSSGDAWRRFARAVGGSWRVDEPYIKVRGRWVYHYHAVDARGQTVDFRLSPKRDVAAAKASFRG